MKKLIFVSAFCTLLLILCSCALFPLEFELEDASRVTVISGDSGKSIEVSDENQINTVKEIMSKHTYYFDGSARTNGNLYTIKFYGSEGKIIENISIIDESHIYYNGFVYRKERCKCVIDLRALESLFNPYLIPDTDSDFEFWITDYVGNIDFSKYESSADMMGGEEYYGKGYKKGDTEFVAYTVTAYPDYSSGGKYVTRIDVTDPNVKILRGLTVNSSIEEWEKVMEEMNCEKITPEESAPERHLWVTEDGKVKFWLKELDGVRSFTLEAVVTNKTGIVF